MSEESKRGSIVGAPLVKQSSSSSSSADWKPSSETGKRIIIKSADMSEDMQKEAVDIAVAAFEKHSVEKDVAETIKKEFDEKHGPTWHCIVGRNFVKTFDFCDFWREKNIAKQTVLAADVDISAAVGKRKKGLRREGQEEELLSSAGVLT
ncbi:Dynein light chain 2, cytoplasmic-like protein [Drosera capensis]